MSAVMGLGMSVAEFYECTPRDAQNFVEGRHEAMRRDIEQNWDYTRHMIIATASPWSKKHISPSEIIHLSRDGARGPQLTPAQEQELKDWSDRMDRTPFVTPMPN